MENPPSQSSQPRATQKSNLTSKLFYLVCLPWILALKTIKLWIKLTLFPFKSFMNARYPHL